MIRPLLFGFALAVGVAGAGIAGAQPRPPEQQEADRAFKNGVARFQAKKYDEALVEFQKAYDISPHPLVLYNIAGCYRELGRHADAVRYYKKFLVDGPGKVSQDRLTDGLRELQGIYALVARVYVNVEPEAGVSLFLDDKPLGTLPLDMPLILPPGNHKLTARAEGRDGDEEALSLVAGKEHTVALSLPATVVEPTPPGPTPTGPTGPGPTAGTRLPPDAGVQVPGPAPVRPTPRRFAVNASFCTNLLRIAEADTGTGSVGLAVGLGSRIELGVDMTVIAYSVIPSLRVRLAGDRISLHAMAAAPISFNDGDEMTTFAAGAAGLALRVRLPSMPGFAMRLESYAAYAGKTRGTTLPVFLGGELWF